MRLKALSLSIYFLVWFHPNSILGDENPVGPEFQVNTYTTNIQEFPSAAMALTGEFVVVWESQESSGTDTSSKSVLGKLFDPEGVMVGDEFQVNTYTTLTQSSADVEYLANGDFVVVWQSVGSYGDPSGFSIVGQRFSSDGIPLGSEIQVNSYTTDQQTRASIASFETGEFVVTWQSKGSFGSDNSGYSIQARRFESGGTAIGAEFQVNTYSLYSSGEPSIGVRSGGEFVVVWEKQNEIAGQRFASDGSMLGDVFQVNTYTTSAQASPDVAVQSNGAFVVSWSSLGSPGEDLDRSIQAQRFDKDGLPLGTQFEVNTYTTGLQSYPSIGMKDNGVFVVVWRSDGADTHSGGIAGQRFSRDGDLIGSEFQVNSHTTGYQGFPHIGMNDSGAFVVAWSGYGPGDTDFLEILGQQYRPILLKDDFESGDTSAWSATMP